MITRRVFLSVLLFFCFVATRSAFSQPNVPPRPKPAPIPAPIAPDAPAKLEPITPDKTAPLPVVQPDKTTPLAPVTVPSPFAPVAKIDSELLAQKAPTNRFVMALAQDQSGALWIGTEDEGVWRYNDKAPEAKRWTQFTTKDGLGDDNAYAIACDKQNRIWIGHLNHGVSVYNGQSWKNYDVLDGPLGERIFDIAIAPNDGSVWMATSAGLTRYQETPLPLAVSRGGAGGGVSNWTYVTRAEGLPSDQIAALAFNAKGDLFAGTQCDGLTIARAADDYKAWQVVRGADKMPNTPLGKGLPGNLINDVLVAKSGAVYVATTCGLARSFDDGATWDFIRGADWEAKVRGLYKGPQPMNVPVPGDLLGEDYTTCLAEDAQGQIYLGHWRRGCEVRDAKANRRVDSKAHSLPDAFDYVRAIATFGDRAILGFYGAGTMAWKGNVRDESFILPAGKMAIPQPVYLNATKPAKEELVIPTTPSFVALPNSFSNPSLNQLLADMQSLQKPLAPNTGVVWGEDWTTKGDWVGRYGRRYAVLCAMLSPLSHAFTWESTYEVKPRLGPHQEGDRVRAWLHWLKTDKPDALYNPMIGYRRQAEWDDHGEVYPYTHEGPDTWLAITVPEGVQRISLYFFNKDGKEGSNRFRDYLLELKPFAPTTAQAFFLPTLARARVREFSGGGVYKQFVVKGGDNYYIRIARNSSFNTICSGVFLDKLAGPQTYQDTFPLSWMGGVYYTPPEYQKAELEDESLALPQDAMTVARAQNLWTGVERGIDRADMVGLHRLARLMAYRTALKSGASQKLLANWRWSLGIWTPTDRAEFRSVMQNAWEEAVKKHPELAGK